MNYTHLSKEERIVLGTLLRQKLSLRQIALELKRSPATLSRELRRNRPRVFYNPLLAEGLARDRHRVSHKHPRLDNKALRQIVEHWIRLKWSPEIIAGRLQRDHRLKVVSHEAIYQWVYAEARHLIPFLPRRHPQRRPHWIPRPAWEIPGRVSVHHRPEEATMRKELGHWEADLVLGRSRSALQVAVERKSRFTRLAKVPNKSAQAAFEALSSIFHSVPLPLRKSVTYDNGKENTLHREINARFGLSSYFCEPHHCWEKPLVENTNGLLRWHFPKRTNFDMIPTKDIRRVERWLNNRPRKCLQFQTPAESLKSLGVALTG